MNKLIIALMTTAFAGSVMASEPAKVSAKTEGSSVNAITEKPASAPKKAHRKHVKKASYKSGMSSEPTQK